MRKTAATLLLIALPLAAAAASPCKYTAPRNADLDAAGLRSVQLNLGSADLDIQGVPGLARIEVRGTACASDAKWLDDLKVATGRAGDRATVDARNESGSHYGLFGDSYAYLKLQVRVPAALAVAVDSGSGDVRASDLASLDFSSGSGDLQADRIAGALALRLGSADARASQVGSVELRGTGSGDVHVDGVHGDVQAGRSGSGDLGFFNVGGSVRIGGTGSGDISLRHIGRDAEVGSTGSGDVDADDVGGRLTVHSTGSGDVSYHGVKGAVDVPRRDD